MQIKTFNAIQYYNTPQSIKKNNPNTVSRPVLNYSNAIYNPNIKFNGTINKEYFAKIITQDPLKKLKNFTPNEYQQLSEEEKIILRADYNKLEESKP